MKRFISVMFLVVALVMMTVPVSANTIKIYSGPYSSGSGGEFTLSPVSGDLPVGWVPQTFCLEKLETFTPGTLYFYEVSDSAKWDGGNYGNMDPISQGTAWLYSEFANNSLAGYPGTNHLTSAGKLQNTIWWLEGEAGDPGAGNIFRQAVIGEFGSANAAMLDNNGLYPVKALNLWGFIGNNPQNGADYNKPHQDMLVSTSVPEPTSLLLLGFGLVGLAGLSRKLRK